MITFSCKAPLPLSNILLFQDSEFCVEKSINEQVLIGLFDGYFRGGKSNHQWYLMQTISSIIFTSA